MLELPTIGEHALADGLGLSSSTACCPGEWYADDILGRGNGMRVPSYVCGRRRLHGEQTMRLRRRSGGTSGDDRSAADRGITYRAAMGDGAQAVGARAVGRARIRRLEIDELVVRRLRILAQLQAQSREFALTAYPEFTEKLLWGGKVVGVRMSLPKAKPAVVKSLVVQACEYKSKMLPARKAKQPAVVARKPKVRPD